MHPDPVVTAGDPTGFDWESFETRLTTLQKQRLTLLVSDYQLHGGLVRAGHTTLRAVRLRALDADVPLAVDQSGDVSDDDLIHVPNHSVGDVL